MAPTVVFLFIVQPGFERATAGKDITMLRGRGRELVEDENEGNSDESCQCDDRGSKY
jgi:hypothetical protein